MGLLLASAALGAFLGLTGDAIEEAVGARILGTVAAFLVLLYGLADLRVLRLPRVGLARQVPRNWLGQLPAGRVYLLFGLILGAGFLTTVPYAAFTAVLVLEIASADAWIGALIGGAYGLGRGAAILVDLPGAVRRSFSTSFVPPALASSSKWRLSLGTVTVLVGTTLLFRQLGVI